MEGRAETAMVAVDLGGTNARLALVKGQQVLRVERMATMAQRGPADLLARLAGVAGELARQGRQQGLCPLGLGVASPGVIDRGRGVVRFSPNLPGWRDVPVVHELTRATGLATVLENDANCYALGEHAFGAGQGHDDLVCLTLGTGVGGGLILGGRLVVGPLGSGGEIGHTLVEPGGRPCGCGARGCLEAYASATGLTGMLREALAQGVQDTRLGPQDDTQRLAQAALAGDDLARELFVRAGQALGRALANLVALTGLDLAVLGGGVAQAWPLMEQACRHELALHLRIVDPAALAIVPAQLGEEAPLLGAADLARRGLEQ